MCRSKQISSSRPRKAVSFGESAEVVVLDVNLSLADREALWYNKDELIDCREGAYHEETTSQEAMDKSRCRHFCRALLSLQEELREMNMTDDPRDLQVFASSHSRHDRKLARERAKQYALEAHSYLGKIA